MSGQKLSRSSLTASFKFIQTFLCCCHAELSGSIPIPSSRLCCLPRDVPHERATDTKTKQSSPEAANQKAAKRLPYKWSRCCNKCGYTNSGRRASTCEPGQPCCSTAATWREYLAETEQAPKEASATTTTTSTPGTSTSSSYKLNKVIYSSSPTSAHCSSSQLECDSSPR